MSMKRYSYKGTNKAEIFEDSLPENTMRDMFAALYRPVFDRSVQVFIAGKMPITRKTAQERRTRPWEYWNNVRCGMSRMNIRR